MCDKILIPADRIQPNKHNDVLRNHAIIRDLNFILNYTSQGQAPKKMDIFSDDVEKKPKQTQDDGLSKEDVMHCLYQLFYLPFLQHKNQYN